jgi:hypothetical protein
MGGTVMIRLQCALLTGVVLMGACPGEAAAGQQLHPTAVESQTMDGARADCEALLNSVLPFAKQMLDQHGEFYPFGGAMQADGQLVSVASHEGKDDPAPADVIESLKDIFTAEAKDGKLKATALVYNVRVTLPSTGETSDAIAVSLDHRENYSVIVFFPYEIEGGSAIIGEAFAHAGTAEIFPR